MIAATTTTSSVCGVLYGSNLGKEVRFRHGVTGNRGTRERS